MPGSSPLARGLLERRLRAVCSAGIIPARAGFTSFLLLKTSQLPGSSPLARGLPSGPTSKVSPWPDHPRSRGVYVRRADPVAGRRGSSPLARGLRDDEERGEQVNRIIPARAGFTTSSGSTRRCRRDHPRSRGVYGRVLGLIVPARGSSPLARGLPVEARRAAPANGDHPRSRGVYQFSRPLLLIGGGSSPLARGLPHLLIALDVRGRIIPARAGFTCRRRTGHRACSDHPRSRGVYS